MYFNSMIIFSKRRNREKTIVERIDNVLNFLQFKNGIILDDGTGSGKIAKGLQKRGYIVGIDQTLIFSTKKNRCSSINFIKAIGEFLPFKSESFDFIISQMVLEHVLDVNKYLQEVFRVLKQNKMVYLALPNRIFPIEPHTKIPLITYFPHGLFQQIINSKIGKTYPLNYLTYKILKMIVAIGFKKVWDIVPYFLKNRARFYPAVSAGVCRILLRAYRLLRFFIPTWIWILQK